MWCDWCDGKYQSNWFRPYKLEDYRFRDAYSGAVHTAWDDVYGALYTAPGSAVAVISNTSEEKRANVLWTVKPDMLGF